VSDYRFRHTCFGFDYGPLKVERIFSDPKVGVVICVGSKHKQFQVRVSPKGHAVEITEQERVHWSEEG
jgi:hypothetical protein